MPSAPILGNGSEALTLCYRNEIEQKIAYVSPYHVYASGANAGWRKRWTVTMIEFDSVGNSSEDKYTTDTFADACTMARVHVDARRTAV